MHQDRKARLRHAPLRDLSVEELREARLEGLVSKQMFVVEMRRRDLLLRPALVPGFLV